MSSVVTLHITSYRGISIGASHWYGTIRSLNDHKNSFEVRYKIEKKHQDWMAATHDPRDWDILDWPIGEETGRFFTREDVIEAAIHTFADNFDLQNDILVLWYPVYKWSCKENKAIIGNPVLYKMINAGKIDIVVDNFVRRISMGSDWDELDKEAMRIATTNFERTLKDERLTFPRYLEAAYNEVMKSFSENAKERFQ